MSASGLITRRGFTAGVLLTSLSGRALAQGFAGLSESADGIAAVTPGKAFSISTVCTSFMESVKVISIFPIIA